MRKKKSWHLREATQLSQLGKDPDQMENSEQGQETAPEQEEGKGSLVTVPVGECEKTEPF